MTGARRRDVGPSTDRIDGYASIDAYAAIGDGRTVALIAADGSLDWLCVPDLDSPPVFDALLDSEGGGRFVVAPSRPFVSKREYARDTNVLRTTFTCERGVARLTDALTIPGAGLFPLREVVRVVEGISGAVPMEWCMRARFDFGRRRSRTRCRDEVAIVDSGSTAVALRTWGAGTPSVVDGGAGGSFETSPGSRATFALTAAHQEPLVVPDRAGVESRLAHTLAVWRSWSSRRAYVGPWSAAVARSALTLKLLVHAPSGAIAAAATTSLPEHLGGERNWDYRYCWVRDSAFILNALLQLGCHAEADAFFWWLMHASQLTQPRLNVLYRLDGGTSASERTVASSPGYRRSRPVRVGNKAADQLQLDIYGDVMHCAWLYTGFGRSIDGDIAGRLSKTATLVTRIWQQADAGMWEVRSAPQHFTQSKMMCWVALDRAVRLAEAGHLPARELGAWRTARSAIAQFVDERCWSPAAGAYTRHPDTAELDAGVLLGVLFAYGDGRAKGRLRATVDAIRRELADGPFLRRYSGDDGVRGDEGAFLACSFWLVEALALLGERDAARGLMDELIRLANDVGLYAEEIDPGAGSFLGNFPQGLTHLALINAAVALRSVGTTS